MSPSQRLFCTILVCALAACGCDDEKPANGKDIVVRTSPDGRFKASIRRSDISGSVMVSQWYQVLVQNVHGPEHQTSVMLSADKTDGLAIQWKSPRLLVVCYTTARIYNFRNTFVFALQNAPEVEEAEVVLAKRPSMTECNAEEHAS